MSKTSLSGVKIDDSCVLTQDGLTLNNGSKVQFPSSGGTVATTSDIPEAQDLSAYTLKSEVANYVDLSEYALKSEIPQAQDLSAYALKTEIPDVRNFATKNGSETLTNKLLVEPIITHIERTDNCMLTVPDKGANDTLATLSDIPDMTNYVTKDGQETLTWKTLVKPTLTDPIIPTLRPGNTGTTITVPARQGTLAITEDLIYTQYTMSNKTLDSPVIAQIKPDSTHTLTLPQKNGTIGLAEDIPTLPDMNAYMLSGRIQSANIPSDFTGGISCYGYDRFVIINKMSRIAYYLQDGETEWQEFMSPTIANNQSIYYHSKRHSFVLANVDGASTIYFIDVYTMEYSSLDLPSSGWKFVPIACASTKDLVLYKENTRNLLVIDENNTIEQKTITADCPFSGVAGYQQTLFMWSTSIGSLYSMDISSNTLTKQTANPTDWEVGQYGWFCPSLNNGSLYGMQTGKGIWTIGTASPNLRKVCPNGDKPNGFGFTTSGHFYYATDTGTLTRLTALGRACQLNIFDWNMPTCGTASSFGNGRLLTPGNNNTWRFVDFSPIWCAVDTANVTDYVLSEAAEL